MRGYWVFIQKDFIPPFWSQGNGNEWDLFSMILVSSDYQTRRCFLFLNEWNQGFWKSKQRDLNHESPLCYESFEWSFVVLNGLTLFHWINLKTYPYSIKSPITIIPMFFWNQWTRFFYSFKSFFFNENNHFKMKMKSLVLVLLISIGIHFW